MDFLSLAKKRYACRKYTAQKVEQAKLDTILEAGRVAPTGANRQPQRLIVVRSEEGMARLARCTRDFGAPCAIIVCADTGQAWERKYDGKVIGDIDASIVTDHMMLCLLTSGNKRCKWLLLTETTLTTFSTKTTPFQETTPASYGQDWGDFVSH